uniref:Uncharacterized protein n=1 Tax=viral metagenome TaxID=1070528 RepID=A0A6C0ECC5_9ZZZZ
MEVESINSIISELKKRKFYYNNDNEPICYIKKKNNNKFILKFSISEYNDEYINNIKYLYNKLKIYCNKYNCKYILFISYIDRIYLYNIKNNLSLNIYNDKIIKLLYKLENKILLKNTKSYLLKCDPLTLTELEKNIINL